MRHILSKYIYFNFFFIIYLRKIQLNTIITHNMKVKWINYLGMEVVWNFEITKNISQKRRVHAICMINKEIMSPHAKNYRHPLGIRRVEVNRGPYCNTWLIIKIYIIIIIGNKEITITLEIVHEITTKKYGLIFYSLSVYNIFCTIIFFVIINHWTLYY